MESFKTLVLLQSEQEIEVRQDFRDDILAHQRLLDSIVNLSDTQNQLPKRYLDLRHFVLPELE